MNYSQIMSPRPPLPRKVCGGGVITPQLLWERRPWALAVEHCLHYTYLSHQLRQSTRHWEILDEEGTLVKSICQKLTFQQSGCRPTIQDPVSRKSWRWASDFIGTEKLIFFSLIHRNQKLTRTVTLICWRLPYCLNVIVFIGEWLWIPARKCSVTPRKSDTTVSTTEHSRLHRCWWMGIIFSTSLSIRLLHLGYPARFGVRRPTTSVCKSTGSQRGNQKKWKEVTIETVRKSIAQ